MRNLKLLILLVGVLIGNGSGAWAQKAQGGSTNSKAQKSYQEGMKLIGDREFEKAIAAFDEAIERDSLFGEAYLRAAGLTRIMQKPDAAYAYYKRGLPKLPPSPGLAPEYLTFADLSFDRGLYSQSAEYYQKFLDLYKGKPSKQSLHAGQQLKNVDFALKAIANPVAYSPVSLSQVVNAMGMQYSPVLTADQQSLLFTARTGKGGLNDENLYLSLKQDGEWQAPVSVSDKINTELNEGAATFSADGRVLVFTSCNRKDSFGSCDLYISYKEGSNWSKPVNMGSKVNTAAWDSQPSLSADGRTIYFASNRQGGLGSEDIWITHQQEDGSWVVPVNAGKAINSPGREAAPFLHASSATLYFATDGRQGMGKLDLFKATKSEKGWNEPENMGYPLNTHRDETSIFITADNHLGYYSGQPSKTGNVLIGLSQFEVPEVWKGKVKSSYAQGKVYDAVTKKPMAAQVQVYYLDSASVLTQQVPSDKTSGAYTIVLNQGEEYALYVTAPGYVLESRHISEKSTTQPLALDFYLQPISKGSKAVLSNLFFDTGKATLRAESRTELDKLYQFMKSNPSVKVEIAGHTDNVGQPTNNLKLSQARAQAVVKYLVSKGIPIEVFMAKGYGETQPKANNNTEENRQLNRRIELRIL
ncbi:hypothetical protein TH61_15590 [Rufibacter sp. DG15C]|uniref:OmpA family protein n=1 Tax=Rufibacter sp. DG15C TaxID=1379909 RepID=UPI00078C06F2|nr:OmpA family protein [Rufibacter sp. DG15C]AMM52326.1 hypothetical protein TH61_15590 [Rufibacter sp. DG15C]